MNIFKKKLIFFVVLLFFNPSIIKADFYYNNTRALGLAGAIGIPEFPDPEIINSNPALLIKIKKLKINYSYIRLLNFNEISSSSFSFNYPSVLPIGFKYIKFINQEEIYFSSALQKNKFQIGINSKFYPKSNSYDFDAGINYDFTYFSIYTIFRNLINKKNYSLGVSYFLSNFSQFIVDYYNEDKINEIIIAQENHVNSKFYLRYGIQTKANRYAVGLGLNLNNLNFDYGLLTHPILDITHAFSVSYFF